MKRGNNEGTIYRRRSDRRFVAVPTADMHRGLPVARARYLSYV